ncbi:hypothetical protein OAT67_03440 [Bacteriovoracaceae bacterium]|nr:hypothetical protein [Bacteriovoracaceae bacterium]|tara:strand:- start:389941 stop:390642 length:702 start_codon:yes stop_codon:yes gene_type:complete
MESNVKPINQINEKDTFLFPLDENFSSKKDRSLLKDFIHFLHTHDVRRPLKFSYIDSDATLLEGLTLRENIYLDSIPTSFSESKEFQLSNFLKRSGNGHLIDLFQNITLLDEFPSQVDLQTKKLAALTKGLLRPSKFLLLECPEKYLNKKNLEIFTNALQYQVVTTGQIVLIATDYTQYWESMANKMVNRNDQNQFRIETIRHKGKIIKESDAQSNDGHLIFVNFNDTKKESA